MLRILKLLLKIVGLIVATIMLGLAITVGVLLWKYDGGDVTRASTPEQQRKLSADPAVIERRRQKYLEQYHQLSRVDDYAAIRKKAHDGNPIAQRYLYEIYERCLQMNTASALPYLQKLATVDQRLAKTFSDIQTDYQRRCTGAAGAEVSGKSYAFWLRRSASGGDLVSEMRVASRTATAPMPVAQLQDFIRRAALSGDPAAIMEIGTILPNVQEAWPDPSTALAIKHELAGHAWVIAACRAGIDCSYGSRVMTNVCLNSMSCHYQNYEAFLYADAVPPSERKRVEVLVMIIQKVLLKPQ
jgi:hypothetical protein